MDSIHDLLQQKAASLDIAQTRDTLQLIQAELDRLYKGEVRIHKLTTDGLAILYVKSAAVATTVRYEQRKILDILNSSKPENITIKKCIIKIAQ